MTVKAIVCLNESPGFELIHDQLNLVEGFSNHLFKYFTDAITMSDSYATERERMVFDTINIDGTSNVELFSSNSHIESTGIVEEIEFGIVKNIDETILISDTDFIGIAGMVQASFGSMQIFETFGVEIEKSLSESAVISEEILLFNVNQNMFNNQMIGSTVFN